MDLFRNSIRVIQKHVRTEYGVENISRLDLLFQLM